MNRLAWILVGVFVSIAGFGWYRALSISSDLHEGSERVDSIGRELVRSRAESEGWRVREASIREDLVDILMDRDTTFSKLVGELEATRTRVEALMDVTAEARGLIVDTVEVIDTIAGTYRGTIDDGILEAEWRLDPPTFSMPYSVRIPGELIVTRTGDGPSLVIARSSDPRASLDVQAIEIPRDTTVVSRWSFQSMLYSAIGGGLILRFLF